MFREPPTSRRGSARQRAARRGQSIVVALLVLLLLGLAGALFVTIVARNLLNARRANRVVTADQYARAGITFADAQLSNSLDGADWRPPLQTTLLNPPAEARELARYTAAVTGNGLAVPDVNDPDAKYLEAGFARYNTGGGRFLLRVTYSPILLKDSQGQYYDPVIGTNNGVAFTPVPVPPGKYLKIESIGREGVIDPLDPTTFTNNRSSDKLQAYQVAYKPIGITDYARFETNPDNRSTTADIGVTSRYYAQDTDGGIITPGAYDFSNPTSSGVTIQPYPILTTYGAPDAYLNAGGVVLPNPNAGSATKIASGGANASILPGGGSFHANMPVRFFGKNIVYLNDAGLSAPLYQDGMEVAGDLLLNGYQGGVKPDNSNASGSSRQIAALILNPPDLSTLKMDGTNGTFIIPSNDTGGNGGFNTRNGLVRDGSPQTDTNGQPRSIGRLEPPRIDATESGSQLPRYKAIALTSPPRTYVDPKDSSGAVQTAPIALGGQYGYGQSLYINNPGDIQQNSQSLGGGSTLVDEWLNRTTPVPGNNKGGWTGGDFYDPPGVNITLGRQSQLRGGSTVNAFGIRLALSPGSTFPNPDGNAGTSSTQTVLYDDINASNDPTTTTSANPDNDVLIYAEGNVRVHGIVSADPADPDTNVTAKDKYPRHVTIVTNGTAYIEGSLLKGNPDSSITILAHDYVCVNTTQFLAGPQSDETLLGGPKGGGDDAYHALAFGSDEPTLIQEINFGLPNGGTPSAAYPNSPLGLYVSARPEEGNGGTVAMFDLVNPTTGLSISGNAPFATPLQSLSFGAAAAATPPATNAGRQYFSLSGLTDSSLATATPFANLTESDTRLLETRRNSNPTDTSAAQNLELERVAILPGDIRIEAVLYAQTGSFFVIPGPWFNSDGTDTLDAFIQSVSATVPSGVRLFDSDPHFPFYGQPIDLKITIDGAVSEAQPADVAVQTAWMLKWGWIPQYHGYASQASGTGPPLESAGHVLATAAGTPANKPAIGLQIIYNPQAGYPYHPNTGLAPGYYLRSDAYGRPLPFSPKLPVSTGLLFAGESSEPPLLQ